MSQLADKVGYSVREIQSALEQMEHMGYIRRESFERTCNFSGGPDGCSQRCEECGFFKPEKLNIWVLTERGQAIIDSQAHH